MGYKVILLFFLLTIVISSANAGYRFSGQIFPKNERTLDSILNGMQFDYQIRKIKIKSPIIDYSILPERGHTDFGLFFSVV